MPSIVLNRALELTLKGDISFGGADTFKAMLTTAAYIPDKRTHDYRDDVTNEVVGTGYTAGGKVIVPTVTLTTASDWVIVEFPLLTWPGTTLSNVFRAVYYKSRGGAASADEIIAVRNFDVPVSTTGTQFNLLPLSMRFKNLTF